MGRAAFQIARATPRNVRVRVSSGGILLTDKTFAPTYPSREINGEGCGVCTGGSIVVSVNGG